MNGFLHWPLDGQIGFVACILGLICLLGSGFVDRRQDHVAQSKGGFLRMHPLRSSAVRGLGFVLIVGLVTYGASQAGFCPGMTSTENAQNRLAGITLAGVFLAVTGYYFYSIYLVRYSFNAEEFVVTDLLLRRTQRFPWTNLTELGVRSGTPSFKLARKRFHLPYGRSGRRQLITLIDSRILRLTAPLVPIYDGKALQELTGKSVLVNLMHIDETYHASLVRSGVGAIDTTSENAVSIRFDDGNTLRATGNLRSFTRTGGKPELIASWYVE